MKRLAALWPVFFFLFALTFAAPDSGPRGVETPEAIKARVQKALDEVAKEPSPRVLVIPIREDIELSTAVYVEREVRRVARDPFDLIFVDVHTNGGLVSATWRIKDALVTASRRDGVPTVAFVNNKAFSAGAMVSMSCDRIYITPTGKIGAAMPIEWLPLGGQQPKDPDREEKMLSAFRGDVRALAKTKGYPAGIAEAMVDRSLEVTEVVIDGRSEFLTKKDLTNRQRELGLDKLPAVERDRRMKVGKVICASGELLTLDYAQARDVGLASGVLASQGEVFEALGIESPVVRVAEHNWSEVVFGFFTTMPIRLLLLLLGVLGLYVEFKVPGFGFPGTFGFICLGLLFFSHLFMGLADYTGVIIFLIGAGLLLVEIFVIPGFGVTGVSGIFCMVVGLFLAMQPFRIPDFTKPWEMELFMKNIIVLGVALFGAGVLAVLLAKFLPSTPLLRRLILVSQGPEGELRASATTEETSSVAVGAKGKTISQLRPAGRAAFEEKFLDVVADGQFIDEGSNVEVIKVVGNRIVVRKVD